MFRVKNQAASTEERKLSIENIRRLCIWVLPTVSKQKEWQIDI